MAAPYSNRQRTAAAMPNKQPRLEIPQQPSHYNDDISPPDSPRTMDGARSSSPNVSPITDAGSIFREPRDDSRTYASSIPLPMQQAPGGTAALIAGWRDKVGGGQALRKRDSRAENGEQDSGRMLMPERTTSALAVPGSGSSRHGKHQTGSTAAAIAAAAAASSNGSPASSKSAYSKSARSAGKGDVQGPAASREEWKGASGRSAIVSPVADRPTAQNNKSKALPTPSQRRKQHGSKPAQGLRQTSGGQDAQGQEVSGQGQFKHSAAATAAAVQSSAKADARLQQQQQMQQKARQGAHEDPSQRFPPRMDSAKPENYDVHRSSPLPLIDTDFQAPDSESPLSPEQLLKSEPPERKESLPPSPPRPATFATSEDLSGSLLPSAIEQLNLHKEPTSRFSTTTYATTIAESPPGTPDLSQDEVPPLPTASILNRKRPVPTSGVKLTAKADAAAAAAAAEARKPSRKPAPSDALGSSPFSAAGDAEGKSLPSTPPGMESIDRVTLLEAKLASLHKRRGNLATVIHELTHVVQPSSISYDLASRQEIKKTVEGLTTEQAAVAKDIHETGLKLHRAMKKRDEFSEPTGLWVRRVTE